MSESFDLLILLEIDLAGRATAIATICDPVWMTQMTSFWRGRGSRDVGQLFRTIGEEFFYERHPGGSPGKRLRRQIAWVSENGTRRFTYVAQERHPHFRHVVPLADPRLPSETTPRNGPRNIAVATRFPKGDAQGTPPKPREKPSKPCARRIDRMVTVLLNQIELSQAHVLTAQSKHIDKQLTLLSKTRPGDTIGRLKLNPFKKLFRVQPTVRVLDQLGRELWRDEYKWSAHEEPHAMVAVVGRLGPGKCITWRSSAGTVRVSFKKRVVRSSPRANTNPYLIILSLVRGDTRGSWRVDRVGAVAVVSRTILMPVDSRYERIVAKTLIRLLASLPEGSTLEKPLPRDAINVGNHSIVPDFVIRTNGRAIYVEVLGDDRKSYVVDKLKDAEDLKTIGHVITIDMMAARSIANGAATALNELTDAILGLIRDSTEESDSERIYSWLPEDGMLAQESA